MNIEQEKKINYKFQILTPFGFKDFDGIVRTKKKFLTVITTTKKVRVSLNHRFIYNNKQIEAKRLKPGTQLSHNEYVVCVKLSDEEDFLYDPINVSGNNTYYGNNLVHHNCNFLGSSLTLINSDTIAQLSPSPPVYSKDGLDIFEKPQKGNNYVMVVDTAKGVGGDYSAFTVIDISTLPYRLVCKYRNNQVSPMLYPAIIQKIGRDYNEAYVLIEINSSEQVATILHDDYEYENIIFVNRSAKNGQVVSGGFGGGKTQLGVMTDKKVKRIGCFNFKSLMEEKKLLLPDADVISEISTFIESKNSYSADEGYNDDLVMTLVLFSWLTTNPYFKELTDVNLRHAIYEKRMQNIEDELTPFGFINDGQEEEKFVDGSGQVWKTEDNSSKYSFL